jgi:TM2 domain-containing membrane protein YozV
MIYLYRTIWAIGYILLSILVVIISFIDIVIYPAVGLFYFIKTGSIENTPYHPMEFLFWVYGKYEKLLEKIEDRQGRKP